MRILGLMSGTSLDAIDVALGEFTSRGDDLVLTPVGAGELPWPAELRAELLATHAPAALPVADWCRLHSRAGRAFGEAAAWALERFGPADLVVSHGQTLHHLVEDGVVTGTLQVGDPAAIHARTGLPVLSDVRAADVAAGGQGAPLASTLDALWLRDEPTAALNLGGIANVTIVGTPAGPVTGDTGPANCLLDAAANTLGLARDDDGGLAAAGRVDDAALARLLNDPYYARPLPKSTGRERFHAGYVVELLGEHAPTGPDLFATLAELTARTVADVIGAHDVRRLVVSGGGVDNPTLMARVRALTGLAPLRSDDLGLPAAAKEAYLMTLIGWLSWHGLPGVALGPAGPVTGARHAAVLGSFTGLSAGPSPAHCSVRYPTRLVTDALSATGPSVAARPASSDRARRAADARLADGSAAGGIEGSDAVRHDAHSTPAPARSVAPTRVATASATTSPSSEPPGWATEPPAPESAAIDRLDEAGIEPLWATERPAPQSADIDRLDTAGIVDVILAADAGVASAVRAVAPQIAAAADLFVAAVAAGGVVHYVGSGTSGRMGVLDAVELLPTYGVGRESVRAHLAGGLEAMIRAAEGAEDDPAAGAAVVADAGPHDLVVGIAASGRTPYVRGALEAARQRNLPTVLLAANPAAPLAGLADVAILPDTGPEVVTGSTRMKAATAQKLVLNALSTAAMIRLGHAYGNLMIDMVATNAKLRRRSVRMLQQATGRDEATCAAALSAGGTVRAALVGLLAGLPPDEAGSPEVRAALTSSPPDPGRPGDPSGVRTARARLGGDPS